MSDARTPRRRLRGRPQVRDDSLTRHLLAEAARSLFMLHGYAGTNIGAVARAAGVSTRTLYRLVPTKAELFKQSVADRIQTFLVAIDGVALCKLDLNDGLERLLRELGNLTLSADSIAIQKLVIAESARFPELAAAFYDEAISTTHAAMTDFLRLHVERGNLAIEDPHIAADMLRGMMMMEPQRAVMMGRRSVPEAGEIAQRARLCSEMFLRGYRRTT